MEVVYVADCWNHAVRIVDVRTGGVRTLAGLGQPGYDACSPVSPRHSFISDTVFNSLGDKNCRWGGKSCLYPAQSSIPPLKSCVAGQQHVRCLLPSPHALCVFECIVYSAARIHLGSTSYVGTGCVASESKPTESRKLQTAKSSCNGVHCLPVSDAAGP